MKKEKKEKTVEERLEEVENDMERMQKQIKTLYRIWMDELGRDIP